MSLSASAAGAARLYPARETHLSGLDLIIIHLKWSCPKDSRARQSTPRPGHFRAACCGPVSPDLCLPQQHAGTHRGLELSGQMGVGGGWGLTAVDGRYTCCPVWLCVRLADGSLVWSGPILRLCRGPCCYIWLHHDGRHHSFVHI